MKNHKSLVPKAQHYVPQFYLRNFAIKHKKGSLIYCCDKVTRKTFRPNVNNIAHQTGLYDFQTSQGEEVSVEFMFSDAETKAQIAIQNILDEPTTKSLQDNKIALANFFASQEIRTPVFRDVHDYMINVTNNLLEKDGFSLKAPEENNTKEFQAQFIVESSASIAEILIEMKWILVKNRSNTPFWTSDNPICRYNPLKSDLVGTLGLKCDGIQLLIPISPWFTIIICDPIGYAHSDSEIYADQSNIEFINSGQVINSRQYIFSIDDNFRLAQEMVNQRSNLSDPKRPRMVAN
jgi:hypothetical protein